MNQAVKLEGEDLWAVLHGSSQTMFAPVFNDETTAVVFACWYDQHPGDAKSYLEHFQAQLAGEIALYLYQEPGRMAMQPAEIVQSFEQWRGRSSLVSPI